MLCEGPGSPHDRGMWRVMRRSVKTGVDAAVWDRPKDLARTLNHTSEHRGSSPGSYVTIFVSHAGGRWDAFRPDGDG